jgi:hypothetical protein
MRSAALQQKCRDLATPGAPLPARPAAASNSTLLRHGLAPNPRGKPSVSCRPGALRQRLRQGERDTHGWVGKRDRDRLRQGAQSNFPADPASENPRSHLVRCGHGISSKRLLNRGSEPDCTASRPSEETKKREFQHMLGSAREARADWSLVGSDLLRPVCERVQLLK